MKYKCSAIYGVKPEHYSTDGATVLLYIFLSLCLINYHAMTYGATAI
jgi:hypothetical protein